MRLLAASAKTLFILLCAGVLVFGTANAANTIVTAMICSPAGSTITLLHPVTDSTFNNPSITVNATVTQASAVSVSVDGIHRTTISLDATKQTISTPILVTEGTHDITLTSQDVCNIQNGSVTAVITYYPNAIPSVGPRIPTVTARPTAGTVTGEAVISYDEPQIVLPDERVSYEDNLIHGVVDESQPMKNVNATPGIIAIPFVVGAGAFGWIHLRRLGQ